MALFFGEHWSSVQRPAGCAWGKAVSASRGNVHQDLGFSCGRRVCGMTWMFSFILQKTCDVIQLSAIGMSISKSFFWGLPFPWMLFEKNNLSPFHILYEAHCPISAGSFQGIRFLLVRALSPLSLLSLIFLFHWTLHPHALSLHPRLFLFFLSQSSTNTRLVYPKGILVKLGRMAGEL